MQASIASQAQGKAANTVAPKPEDDPHLRLHATSLLDALHKAIGAART